MRDWLGMTAADLGRGIAAGRIGPVALTETFLGAIADHPLRDRIYARLTPDRARAEAMAAEARAQAGHRLSPLDGVPISWKDLYDTAGVATESGSKLLEGRTPAQDARVLTTATRLGLVCLGKTHQTELAFSGLGYNPVTATPPCVNDPDAVPGGSSSGAAASVAFGLAAAGIGSDTGGSVRVPSAWNDLVGLKTSPGRLSLEGVVPLCAKFDTVGPLCRSVEDAALLLAALEGRPAADLRGATLDGARLLILDTVAFDDIRDAPLAGFDAAVRRLEAAGAIVTRGAVPAVAEAMPLSGILFATEAYGTWKDVIEANPSVMFPRILERFRGGRDFSGADYVAAWLTLDKLRKSYLDATAGYDAVILPTCPILPPKIAAIAADTDLFTSENLLTLRNTRIGNLMGLPSLTLPTGVPSTGISFLTPPMSEERLLRLGAAAERALA
jgi:aspartyl-tRNA(Asn)/glutamyl-tRNA(Gln) amidotransferase subunit A